jgi:hypothetical protein
MSWLSKLEEAKVEMAARNGDPWRLPLERLHGKIDYDGLERVSSQTLLDILEVPRHLEPSSATRHKRTGWDKTVGCLLRPPVIVRDAE